MKNFIVFIEMKSALKTRQFLIKNLSKDLVLGRIAYEPHWRQYCFYPLGETVWSDGCLEEIQQQIKHLREVR
jgi:hypothetical protein